MQRVNRTEGTKRCTHCARVLPLDAFHRNGTSAYGQQMFSGACKACVCRQKRERYARDPRMMKRSAIEWKRRNPERAQEYTRRWREKHRAQSGNRRS